MGTADMDEVARDEKILEQPEDQKPEPPGPFDEAREKERVCPTTDEEALNRWTTLSLTADREESSRVPEAARGDEALLGAAVLASDQGRGRGHRSEGEGQEGRCRQDEGRRQDHLQRTGGLGFSQSPPRREQNNGLATNPHR